MNIISSALPMLMDVNGISSALPVLMDSTTTQPPQLTLLTMQQRRDHQQGSKFPDNTRMATAFRQTTMHTAYLLFFSPAMRVKSAKTYHYCSTSRDLYGITPPDRSFLSLPPTQTEMPERARRYKLQSRNT